MLRISLTMKREIQNASYRLFINNESTSLTMSVSTYRLIVSELRSISRNVPLEDSKRHVIINKRNVARPINHEGRAIFFLQSTFLCQ